MKLKLLPRQFAWCGSLGRGTGAGEADMSQQPRLWGAHHRSATRGPPTDKPPEVPEDPRWGMPLPFAAHLREMLSFQGQCSSRGEDAPGQQLQPPVTKPAGGTAQGSWFPQTIGMGKWGDMGELPGAGAIASSERDGALAQSFPLEAGPSTAL